MKFNKTTKFENIPWQSGGTDITDVAKETNQRDSDLTIIMTDGYYTTDVAFKKKNVVWLISEKGGLSHPCRDVGKTFLLEDLING
jgi:predicted metal-dependent peptidase